MLFFSTGAVKRANPLHLDTEMSVPTFAAKQKILFLSHLKTSKIKKQNNHFILEMLFFFCISVYN